MSGWYGQRARSAFVRRAQCVFPVRFKLPSSRRANAHYAIVVCVCVTHCRPCAGHRVHRMQVHAAGAAVGCARVLGIHIPRGGQNVIVGYKRGAVGRRATRCQTEINIYGDRIMYIRGGQRASCEWCLELGGAAYIVSRSARWRSKSIYI